MRLRVILLALIVASCGSPATAPSTSTSATTTSFGSFVITADAGVSVSDQNLVRDEMVNVGLPYFAANFGWQPARPVQITMSAVGSPTASPGEAGVGGADGFIIYVYPNWSPNTEAFKRDTVVHELFHVLQLSIGWNLLRTAEWMVEGSAEYASYRAAIIDNGLVSADQVRACKEHLVIVSQPAVPPLSQLEGSLFITLSNQVAATYPDAYLAVEHLMQNVPLRTLPNVGVSSMVFADAFQATFATSLAAFYNDFEQYRQSWQPPSSPFCGF